LVSLLFGLFLLKARKLSSSLGVTKGLMSGLKPKINRLALFKEILQKSPCFLSIKS
jgi:hypothetical protein